MKMYKTVSEVSKAWNLTPREVQILCSAGKIDGAVKFGRAWAIPSEAKRPVDRRFKCTAAPQSGFTLIEMLVVIAVIAVLVAIIIPTANGASEKAKEAVDLSNVRSAYAKVMMAAVMGDTSPSDDVTYMHGRWYMNVDLKQQQSGWQTDSNLNIAGISPADTMHWVGIPAAKGNCTISYSEEEGATLAWVYNFAHITNTVSVPKNYSNKQYAGKTINQLIHDSTNFPMLESSGTVGRSMDSQIKHQLGLNDTDDFSYKVLPSKQPGMDGRDCFEIYISTSYTLKTNVAKNQSKFGTAIVTGYIYKIEENGASTLLKTGTPQEIATYTNASSQEKFDVYGDQNTKKAPTNTAYDWNV